MDHDLLTKALDAHRGNDLLAGQQLLDAARGLLALCARQRRTVMAYDAAGERILGAAMAMDENRHILPMDRTAPVVEGFVCLLVGGFIAGPVAVADRADEARQAGATSIDAAILGGWHQSIVGVQTTHILEQSHVAVA